MITPTKLSILIALIIPLQLFSQIKLVSEEGADVPYAHIFLDGKAYTFSDE